jgi:hypothetical protein
VINQSDNRRQVSRDVTALMEEKLGDRLLGIIHRDESVVEANASQKSIPTLTPPPQPPLILKLLPKNLCAVGYQYW